MVRRQETTMTKRSILVTGAAVALALGLGVGVAAAQTDDEPPRDPADCPYADEMPDRDRARDHDAMHDQIGTDMPEGMREQHERMHAGIENGRGMMPGGMRPGMGR
jgi:hypothetical protein